MQERFDSQVTTFLEKSLLSNKLEDEYQAITLDMIIKANFSVGRSNQGHKM